MIMRGKTEALEENPVPVPIFSATNRKMDFPGLEPKSQLQVEKYSASLVSLYWRSGYFTLKANTITRFE